MKRVRMIIITSKRIKLTESNAVVVAFAVSGQTKALGIASRELLDHRLAEAIGDLVGHQRSRDGA